MTTPDITEIRKMVAVSRTLDAVVRAVRDLDGTGFWTEREQTVLNLRLLEHETLDQVGARFHVTRERIRQIEAKALRKLRSANTEPTPSPKETLTPEKARARISDIESSYRKEYNDAAKRVETLSAAFKEAISRVSDMYKASWQGSYPELQSAKSERDRLFDEYKQALRRADELKARRTDEVLRTISQPPAKFNMAMMSKFQTDQTSAISTAAQTVRNFIGEGTFDSLTLEARKSPGKRSYYLGGAIHLSKSADKTIVAHEIGHWLEDVDKDINRKAIAFRKARTEGETPVQLRKLTGNKGYATHEYTLKDRFRDPYSGKLYPMDKHTEIISMGLQRMLEDPVSFASEDPDYFDFIFSLFRTKGGGK